MGNIQVVGNGRDFSLKKRMLFTTHGGKGRQIIQNSDLPKSHTSYLKDITSLSVGNRAKKDFKAV